MLLILMLNRAGQQDATWQDPDLLLVQLWQSGAHCNPERTFRQEVLNKHWEMAPETKIPEVRQNAVLPCCVVGLPKAKENGYDKLFFDKSTSNKVSKWTRWSHVLWFLLKSHCFLERRPCDTRDQMIIIMYIYHALINALSAHMIHSNLNMIFYTHVEHSPTETIYIEYYMETHTHTCMHARTYTCTHYTHTHTHTMTVAETGYWY